MDKFEVAERQVYRDLNTIANDLRVPLVKQERHIEGIRKTCYCLEVGYLPSLTPEKATVLILSLVHKRGSTLTCQLMNSRMPWISAYLRSSEIYQTI